MQFEDEKRSDTNVVIFLYVLGVILMMIGIVFLLPGLTGSVVGSRLGSDLIGSVIFFIGAGILLGAWKWFVVR